MIFDLDGTLIDSVPDLTSALAGALAERGRPPLPVSTVRHLVGHGARSLCEKTLHASGEAPADVARDLDAFLERFREHYSRCLVVETTLYPGVRELLALLHGVPLAVLTNKPGRFARPIVEQLGVAGAFFRVLGDGDGFARKPDPSAARALVDEAGAAVARTLVVGDGVPDMALATSLGSRSVAVSWGYASKAELSGHGAGWFIDKPMELLEIVGLYEVDPTD